MLGQRAVNETKFPSDSATTIARRQRDALRRSRRTYQWQRNARGTPTFDLSAESFVVFLQNHDQVANSGTGERCHALTSPGRLRAMTAYFLLMPGIPMLFQGQEFGASSPFFYFADHESGLSHGCPRGAPPLPRAISQSRDQRDAGRARRSRRHRHVRWP